MTRRRLFAATAVVAMATLAAIATRSHERARSAVVSTDVVPADAVAADKGAATSAAYRRYVADIMATSIEAVLPSDAPAGAAEIVFSVFRDVDQTMSEWKPDSAVAAVNRAAGRRAVVVPADLFALIGRGIEMGRLTDGAYDISWAALWGVWDFKAEQPKVPPKALLRRRAALVDYRQIELDDKAQTVRLPRPGMRLGLGGIAKGYALDRAASALQQRGIASFMLVSGGQVLVRGQRGRRPWRVGIRNPRGGPSDYFMVLQLQDTSVSTSGDYERYFEVEGKRYHHILDPKTGEPTRGLRSATVVCADAALADALSTAVMVLGPRRGLNLLQRLPQVEGVLVDARGAVHATRRFHTHL